jgi:indolepyruvate ferredoxin oxidoreductase beta subunit
MSGDSVGQQLIISGVGGQGILFVTRLLAEAAIGRGMPVLTSETHGMAQRGGVVISHLKAGAYASPLVRPGRADLLLLLKGENLPLHRHFLKPGGLVIVNGAGVPPAAAELDARVVDADRLALELANPQGVNLILLGFALAAAGKERLFCSHRDILTVLERRLAEKGRLLVASVQALEAGIRAGEKG